MKLDYEPETFPLAGDHFILRFPTERDYALVWNTGPWLVAGQLLAVEPWESDFTPSRWTINKVVMWLRLPELPLEY